MKYMIKIVITLSLLLVLSCDDHEFKNPADLETGVELTGPVEFSVEQLTVTSCELSWAFNGNIAIGFKIDRKQDDEDWLVAYKTLNIDKLNFTDTDLKATSSYKYKVYAFVGDNNSSSMQEEIAMTFPAPTDLDLSQASVTSCQLNWSDNSNGEEGFKIDRKKDDQDWVIAYQSLDANQESYSDNELEARASYQYRVYAFVDDNTSNSSQEEIAMIFPAPTDLVLSQTSVTSCKLTWSDNSNGEEGFKIDRKKDDQDWIIGYQSLDANQETYIDDSLEINSTYSYRVYGFNNDVSSNSTINNTVILFNGPDRLLINRESISSCSLWWNDNSNGEDGFKIDRKKGNEEWQMNYQILNEDVRVFNDENLEVNQVYQYRVRAYFEDFETDAVLNSISMEFNSPTNLEVVQQSIASCDLSWNDNTAYEDGYIVDRKKDDDDWNIGYKMLNVNVNGFVDEELEPYSLYSYRVYAYTDNFTSNFSSNEISMTFPALSDLEVSQTSLSSCQLIWSDNSNGEDGFKIDRKQDDQDWIIGYQSLDANQESFVDTELEISANYQYRVYAFLGDNNSNSSQEEILLIIPAPSDLDIIQTSLSSCQLIWSDNSNGEEGFKFDRKKDDQDWIIGYQNLDANQESFVDTELEISANYQYRVYAFLGDNNSNSSQEELLMIIPAPSDLEIIQTSPTSCQLIWSDNSNGEEGFKIDRKKDDQDWIIGYQSLDANQESYTDDDLETNSIYHYRMCAFSGNSNSDYVEESINTLYGNLIFVEGDTFTMGDHFNEGGSSELPLHQVTINSFYIGKYEVTQAEYQIMMEENPSSFLGSVKPVESVTWYNAVEYCNARSLQEGLTPCYDTSDWSCDFTANGYRLPTEAEWEYAARGGVNHVDDYRYSGCHNEADLTDYAWYSANSNSQTHEVGNKNPNQLGIYDMSGNVMEWCNDWYDSDYYSSSPSDNPNGPNSGSYRILRGGAWIFSARYCSVASRRNNDPDINYHGIGFRLVRSLD